jgi:UDPglucose 6-dehydrogenase
MNIGIIGLGVVGSALMKSFEKRNINLIIYDKYKNIGNIELTLNSDILFLALPTPFDDTLNDYNIDPILHTLNYLNSQTYKGIILIKSTVIPSTIKKLSNEYQNLKLIHNPEFLSMKTATEDVDNQKNIILGLTPQIQIEDKNILSNFFSMYYPNAKIMFCSSDEAESVKIFSNSFYAVKVQFFTEIFTLCQNQNINYENVVQMMIENEWINPMHTKVPGPDGQISYGGACLPKDIKALNSKLEKENLPNAIIKGAIDERNQMRKD